jgi:transcriptional regulator with XRE-family HTH domain
LNKIKTLRQKLGISIYDIAKSTGLAPSYISNLEHGRRTNPSLDVMQRISSALGKKVEEVFKLN